MSRQVDGGISEDDDEEAGLSNGREWLAWGRVWVMGVDKPGKDNGVNEGSKEGSLSSRSTLNGERRANEQSELSEGGGKKAAWG